MFFSGSREKRLGLHFYHYEGAIILLLSFRGKDKRRLSLPSNQTRASFRHLYSTNLAGWVFDDGGKEGRPAINRSKPHSEDSFTRVRKRPKTEREEKNSWTKKQWHAHTD